MVCSSSKRQTPIREAICGGDAALPAPFTMRLGMIAHAGRHLASECLEGHHFDPFNFNALCNVVRYDHLKAGNWSAFNSVAKPEL